MKANRYSITLALGIILVLGGGFLWAKDFLAIYGVSTLGQLDQTTGARHRDLAIVVLGIVLCVIGAIKLARNKRAQ